MKLVPAGADDIDAAERLVFANMQPYLRDADLAWESERFRQGFVAADNYLLSVDAETIGFLSLTYAANHTYVRELQLIAAYRRRGIGSWLIGEVERSTRQRGLSHIRLRVLKTSPALALYRRHGFRMIIEEAATLGLEKSLAGSSG
ncbi:GNAT family N-acetyltransferase [Halomonas sp. HP20-15]|uniref:GNAT family N-acetyltransferase n=1 Tax=Halomonas sp. HP20-15 TaxID=3085901 RepID=UPI0029824C59|nr:GNAT family N-acetyltransferase [Halomonas sp. HP20-15]MDW5378121.1 GNAT family N-acetyltransferase [Halomonas sp. HP20-15]